MSQQIWKFGCITLSWTPTTIPTWRRNRIVSKWPCLAAHISGVSPCSSTFWRLAPCFWSCVKTANWPCPAAMCAAVSPCCKCQPNPWTCEAENLITLSMFAYSHTQYKLLKVFCIYVGASISTSILRYIDMHIIYTVPHKMLFFLVVAVLCNALFTSFDKLLYSSGKKKGVFACCRSQKCTASFTSSSLWNLRPRNASLSFPNTWCTWSHMINGWSEVWTDLDCRAGGTPRHLATATQPRFPRIVISLNWTHVNEWSSANWGNGNASRGMIEELNLQAI
jgi:hypothetical protein